MQYFVLQSDVHPEGHHHEHPASARIAAAAEDTARRLGRGKNWIVVRALEEYLAKGDERAFIQEACRQSVRASEGVTPDEVFWEEVTETTDWRA